MNDQRLIRETLETINLALVIDASGRAGNLFFLTVFDNHKEFSCCPIVQYLYSYTLAEFPDEKPIPTGRAKEFLTKKSYFRLVYGHLNNDDRLLFFRMGGDPDVKFDRDRLQNILDKFFNDREFISRKELIAAPMIAYSIVRGCKPQNLKYILVGDAISCRDEDVRKGFSGAIIDSALHDFPHAKVIHLVRDPRATFASPRHQYVNSMGNMYCLKFGNFFDRLLTLLAGRLTPENGCIYLFWLLYLRQTETTMTRKKHQYGDVITIVKNEDLNLDFNNTICEIANRLGVSVLGHWLGQETFIPTVIGAPWEGSGAYNSRYQQFNSGLLKNDPDVVSKNVTGPNEYVTSRWKQRLNQREIKLIEHLFYSDLKKYGYQFLYSDQEIGGWFAFFKNIVGPFNGELPKLKWMLGGFKISFSEGANRVFFAIMFPPFYFLSRVKLALFYRRGVFF
jgi:hypothetical protein